MSELPKTDQERRSLAEEWCARGPLIFRILETYAAGFKYDGIGFFSPRFKTWRDALKEIDHA